MIRRNIHIWSVLCFIFSSARSQEVLPEISARNFGGRIVISWKNEYTAPLANISIQRSFDSLKNYTTIGSVLNPANRENGYSDAAPPYEKMYYRVFIGFENGSYTYSRPVKAIPDEKEKPYGGLRYSWQYEPVPTPQLLAGNDSMKKKNMAIIPAVVTNPVSINPPEEKKPLINYVSLNRDQNVTLYLPDAADKSYSMRFFDEAGREVFKLNKLKEEIMVIEKVNFIHSGWFGYELYEGGGLLIKEKIFIPKDQKPGLESRRP